MEINKDIIIPTPEEIEDIENYFLEHESFLITIEYLNKLKEKAKDHLED